MRPGTRPPACGHRNHAAALELLASSISTVRAFFSAFGGSGTTLIAAHRTGRVARLLEIDFLYVDVIIRRWHALSGEQALHADTGQTFAGRAQALEIAVPGEAAP